MHNNTSQTQADLPHFMQQQFAFTQCLRDPEHAPIPNNIEPRRIAAYQEVVYNNFEDLLAHNFPIIREITTDQRWHSMVRDFILQHRCQTPYFPQFGTEFIQYLEHTREDPNDPPFLLELAHYEWMELKILLSEIEVDLSTVNRAGDLLNGYPVVSPLAHRLAYEYPVHQISPDFQPQEPGDAVSCIVVYRHLDAEESVGFLEINPITDRLLALLQTQETPLSGAAILAQLAQEMQHPNPEVVIAGGAQILQTLHTHEIILGTQNG